MKTDKPLNRLIGAMERLIVFAVAAGLQFTTAAAQSPASVSTRIIVAFPPGGGTDIIARTIAQKLSEAWAQPVYVDNRPGANGTIGTAVAAKSAPDGRTILVVPHGFAVNPAIYPTKVPRLPQSTLLRGMFRCIS